MKKFIAYLLSLTLILTVLGGCSSGNPSSSADSSSNPASGNSVEPREIKFSVLTSDESAWGVMAHRFAERLEERSNGRYKVTVYANDQLGGGDSSTIISMLQEGSLDMEICSLSIYQLIEPQCLVLMTPWLFDSYEDADEKLGGGAGDLLKGLLDGKGIKVLALGESGFRQLVNSKREVRSPDDMVGLKVRVPSGSLFIDMYMALGADPATIANPEVFMGLQQGTVDGAENFTDLIYSGKYQEVCKYMTIYNANYDCSSLSISQKTFDSLPDEDKELFISIAEEVAAQQKAENREDEQKLFDEMSQYMEITYLTKEEVQKFKDKMGPVYEKYAGNYDKELLAALGLDMSKFS